MPGPVIVDFYFSPASPYAYLAGTQMMKLQIETGCRVDWYPVSARLLIKAAGYDLEQAVPHSGQFRPDYRRTDLARFARLYSVPFRDYRDVVIPDPPRLALACVAARRFDAGQVFARALMKAIFVDGTSPVDDALCATIAGQTGGIDQALFLSTLDDPETIRLQDDYVQTARSAGCFGVPSFVVNGKEMVFGNDRLALLHQAVLEAKAAG